jgi:hypothetical protein
MSDTVTTPDQSAATRAGEQLGRTVAEIVILHFHAMQAGGTAGYAAEYRAALTGVPVPDLVPVPDRFAPVADRYRDAFTEARAAYRAGIP